MSSPGILGEILARTRERVAAAKNEHTIEWFLTRTAPARRAFGESLGRPGIHIVAEHKRRSPSRGIIREDLAPNDVARAYASGGATAVSVLTEPHWFGGRLSHLDEIRSACMLPVLRKDFIVDPWQIWESRGLGADALLLIVAALSDAELKGLLACAEEARIEALVEVHDKGELTRAVRAGARMVGVNNRDLKTLEVSLDTGLSLAGAIPDDVVAVAESGIKNGADLRRLREAGYDAFLIGEQLMTAADPGAALASLIGEAVAR